MEDEKSNSSDHSHQLCPELHPLTYTTTTALVDEDYSSNEFVCDKCGVIYRDSAVYHCTPCEYDLCTKCYTANNSKIQIDYADLIIEFCSVTGTQAKMARSFLNAFSWDINMATTRFHECNGDITQLTDSTNVPVPFVLLMENINEICYCSDYFRREKDEGNKHGWRCTNCWKESNDIIDYLCITGRHCPFCKVTGFSNVICAECWSADVPEEVMRNDFYSGNEYDEKEVLIHRKVMMSLNRIS